MQKYLKKIPKYFGKENRALVLTLLFLLIFSVGSYALASFFPGQYIDPPCAPGSGGCFVDVFPDQTANSGKFLTTNGTATSWATVSGSGTVTSVSNSDSTITVSGTPTIAPVVSLNLGHSNTWTAAQIFNAQNIATTVTPRISLTNTTAATDLIPQQFSPAEYFLGKGSDGLGGASHTYGGRIYYSPNEGPGRNRLLFESTVDGTTWNPDMFLQTGNDGTTKTGFFYGTLVANNGITSNTSVTAQTSLNAGIITSSSGSLNLSGITSGTVSLGVQSAAGTYSMKLPTSQGALGTVLTEDGAGNLSWGPAGGTTYTFLNGLTEAPAGTVKNDLITGVSGGQTVIGGLASTDNLIIEGTKSVTGRTSASPAITFFSGGNASIGLDGAVQQEFVTLQSEVTQTAIGGYTALKISMVENSLGSGSKYLINTLAGAAGTTSEFSVSNTGVITANADAIVNGVNLGKGGGSSGDTVFGNGAGASTGGGSVNNSFFGYNSGNALSSGSQNTFLGNTSGSVMTNGVENTSVGAGAMSLSSSGGSIADNTAVGSSALISVTGNFNTAIGAHSGLGVTTGAYNTLLGSQITGVTSGSNNIIVSTYNGVSPGGNSIITGSYNTSIGGYVGVGDTSNTVTLSDGQGNITLFSPSNHHLVFGGTAVDNAGLLQLFAPSSSGAPNAIHGSYLNIMGGTFSDNVTGGGGSTSGFVSDSIGQATLSASNTPSVTTTNAYGLFLEGAPVKGANEIITNTTAFNIAAGAVGPATRSYGMQVNAQTGAGNNFAAVFNGGNVGIGTTLPASKLNVVLSPMLTPNYGTVSIGNGAWDGGSAGFFSGSTSGNSLAINEDSSFLGDLANFQTAGVPKLSIDYQGNLESHGDLYSKGLYWTTRQTFGAGLQYKSVAFGNGLFVGVADGGTTANDVVTSPDGINWTTHTITNAVTWTGVTYGNGMFVAVAQDGTTAQQIMSSPDGINWTPQTSPVANKWVSVTYGNGTFVAVASNGTVADQVMTSVDGVTWNAQTIANTETWADVTYGNGLFVAIASTGGGTKSIMTSPDGITWTWRASQDPAIDGNLPAAITYGNGLFVVVYNYAGGSKVQTSPDGINWTYRNSVGASGIQHIGYGNGLFVGFSDNSVGISMVSRDGITWTTDMQNVSGFFHYDIAYGNGMFVSFDNKNAVQTSGYNDYQTVQNNNKFNGGMTITGLTANAGYSSVCISTTGVLTFASTTCNNPSALRFKTDVETLTGNLDKVTALRPVGYTSLVDKGHYVGFIAEEVAPIEKRLVNFNENGEAIGLNYAQFAPLLAGAIQEVNIKVKNLSSIDVNQDGSLASLITRFLGDAVVSIKEATISTLHIGEKVCVDDVCVTKEQFKQILINGGASGATSTPATTDATPPATDTTPESVPPATIDASTTPPPADVVTPDAPPSDPATPPVEIP